MVKVSYYGLRSAVLASLAITSICTAQNLIPNGDLEGKKGKISPHPWVFVNTIDYFVYNDVTSKIPDPVDMNQKLRKPHNGQAYLGMRIWGTYREYIEIKISEPLKSGKNYSFTMFVAVSPYSNSIATELGANFSKGPLALSDYTVINKTKPQVEFTLTRSYKDSTQWFVLKGTFKAKGGEKFLSIGHFTNRFKTHFVKNKAMHFMFRKEAYYYFDDISLFELDDAGNEKPGNSPTPVKVPAKDTVSHQENYLEKLAEKPGPVIMKNIYFDSGRSELLPESFDELGMLTELLNNDTAMEIEIIGHTDNSGNEKENMLLSGNRAKAVVNYLVDQGIKVNRLTYSGKGSTVPIAGNDSEEGKQQNRRVEFVIRKK